MIHGNPSGEKRFLLAYFILFLIGAGSAGLHGTLHWFFQSSDELPMLYLINSLNFIIEEYDAPMGKPKHPHLVSLLVGISVLNTLVYYRYQDMYMIFLATFALSNARLDYKLLRVLYSDIRKKDKVATKIGLIAFVTYALLAFPIWVVDMLQCERVLNVADQLPGIFKGMTLHVFWHIFAAHGAYCTIVSLACCRMAALDRAYQVYMIMGFIPIVKAKDDKSD
jgi:dihydroceramidase